MGCSSARSPDARAALGADRERLRERAGANEAEIFDAHAALLDDEALLEPARAAVAAGATAEAAIEEAATAVAEIYRRIDDPLLAERAADVLDVGNRVRAALDAERPASASENDNDSVLIIEFWSPMSSPHRRR